MSEEILEMLNRNLEGALRKEAARSKRLQCATRHIPVAHIFRCYHAKPILERLLQNLIITSQISFDKFIFHFFRMKQENSFHEIEFINQSAKVRREHPAVILLEHLSRRKNSLVTVGDLIESLDEAKLYRIIADLERQGIQACCVDVIPHSLGTTEKDISCLFTERSGIQSIAAISPPTGFTKKINKSRGLILITFVEDGRSHANTVKGILETASGKSRRSYHVFFLSDFSSLICTDELKNILWILSQVDFVVPILTEDYLTTLDDKTSCKSSSIDVRYAPLVARVMLDDWASSFKNKKLRCFKPCDVDLTSKLIYPPFKMAVDDPSFLRGILKKSRQYSH